MTEAPKILLDHHLESLRLPTVLREYGKLARHCAAEGLDHVQFLARLVELEMIDRERRMIERRIKAAKFPAVKSPPSHGLQANHCRATDSFDFKAIPGLNKMQVLELARCEWIDRRENVIMPEACLRHDALGPVRHCRSDQWREMAHHWQNPHRPRPRAGRLPEGPVPLSADCFAIACRAMVGFTTAAALAIVLEPMAHQWLTA